MEAIINFLKGIVDFISMLFDFVVGLIEDIVYIVKLTAEFVVKIPSFFGWLPAGALTLIVAAFAVVVIYKVLGREG